MPGPNQLLKAFRWVAKGRRNEREFWRKWKNNGEEGRDGEPNEMEEQGERLLNFHWKFSNPLQQWGSPLNTQKHLKDQIQVAEK
jgi:hypothetical protein